MRRPVYETQEGSCLVALQVEVPFAPSTFRADGRLHGSNPRTPSALREAASPDKSCSRRLTHHPAAGPRAPILPRVINYHFAEFIVLFSGPHGDLLSSSVLTLEQAVLRFGRQNRNGRRIVFTNGCFELLHPGHIRILEQARALGDVLVVGLNSDASVRRLKGKDRPVWTEQKRAEVLAAMECVDAVVIFENDTPREVISQLLPDVLVKGDDWPLDQIVGREEVERAGGEVVRVPILRGYSTTDILRKIREGTRASRADS
jgi:rfaE bifunctional protein nucleotidyltransferase chain/domain